MFSYGLWYILNCIILNFRLVDLLTTFLNGRIHDLGSGLSSACQKMTVSLSVICYKCERDKEY